MSRVILPFFGFRRPVRAVLCLLSLSLGASVASGQETGQETIDPQAAFSDAGETAFARVRANDLAGAIELLEPARDAGTATPVDLGLLGTLYLETGNPSAAFEVLRPMADQAASDAAVLFNAGRAALQVGEAALGERYLERSVSMMPVSPAARALGLLRANQGRTVQAFQLLRPWALRNPDDNEARLAAAALALRLDRPKEAGPLLADLPDSQPRVRLLRGQLLIQQGDVRSALLVLEPLLEKHPPELKLDLFRITADAYLNVGRAEDAVKLLKDQINSEPRSMLLYAEALYRTGDVEAAVAILAPHAEAAIKESLDARPLMLQTIVDYGRMLVAAGRHGDAVTYLAKATTEAPNRALAWKNYGEALMGSGQRDEAKTALARFQELTQAETESRREAEKIANDPVAQSLARASAAFSAGEGDKGWALLQREIAISPGDLRPRLFLTQALARLGRVDEALASAQASVAAFPDQPDAIYLRGAIQLAQNERDRAEQDFRRALELFPDHVAAMSDLGVLLTNQGQNAEARRLFERVLELRPEDKRAAESLAQLRQRASG